MSDREIRELLRQLNNDAEQSAVAYELLSGAVCRAAVVTDLERSMEQRGGLKARPHSFYFIRSGDGRFVGAVNDGGSDLHWYMVRPFRGQGLMSNALREVILPHIATKGHPMQQITINRGIGRRKFAASEHLALSVGFQVVSDPECEEQRYELHFNAQPLPHDTRRYGVE